MMETQLPHGEGLTPDDGSVVLELGGGSGPGDDTSTLVPPPLDDMLVTDEEEPVDGAAFTCRFTAALRHVESTCIKRPVLRDPLAPLLCGPKALALARQELDDLRRDQGPGKHLRVPARTALIDQQLMLHLGQLAATSAVLAPATPTTFQVVSLGCGMDTRPWRLPQLSAFTAAWFDVDVPDIARLKLASLQAAQAGGVSACVPGAPPPAFPLLCASYQIAGADLSSVPLSKVLSPESGFTPALPTVWILEAVIYYMPLEAASALLTAMAALSAPGSSLILTCADEELLEASRSRMEDGHIFAGLWHFYDQELLACHGYAAHWRTLQPPLSTKRLALSSLNADTYVALYGGAECLLTAEFVARPCLPYVHAAAAHKQQQGGGQVAHTV